MITSILSFSLKSMICSGIFMGYYLLVLKNAPANHFNRVYLLAAALLSLLLPFTSFDLFHIAPTSVPDIPLLDISGTGTAEAYTNVAATQHFNWQAVWASLYFAVASAMVLRLIAKFIWVYRLRSSGHNTIKEGFQLIKTDDPRAPFSFMHMLFWPTHMRHDSPEGNRILQHELAHIKQLHTVDKILMQLMLAACWLNPFNWLMRNELWLQHEFLADKQAIEDGDTETFAKMLLYSVTNTTNRSVISPFFQSPIKRRLLMLTRNGKSPFSLMRRFLAIPILFIAVLLMALDTDKSAVLRSPEKIVLVLDAGHGGEDVGGKSIYGDMEKDITLSVCKKLTKLSSEYNIEIVPTRAGDTYPTLEERIKKGNSTDNAIFLSIHVNKNTTDDVRKNNYELGINPKSKNYDKSRLLASSIANKLKDQNLTAEVVDLSKVYVIRESKHPALLMECGNLDDAENMALLKDETRTEALCRNILSGIVDYNTSLNTKK